MMHDLSMPIDSNIPSFPGDPKATVEHFEKEGILDTKLIINAHFSTHMDAPSHMIKEGKSLDDFPLEKFSGEAIVFDVRGSANIEPDLSAVKPHNIVLFFTGHTKNRENPDYFDTSPVLTEKTAHELVKLKVSMVGIDSFSVDSSPFKIHKILLSQNILLLENLVNLAPLAGKRIKLTSYPLNITRANGAPCRVIAML